MIFCDDSGWGSLLGGVMIGVYDSDTKKCFSKLIPVKYFQGSTFKKGIYRRRAELAFIELLSKCSDSEYFYVCRGTVLDTIYNTLVRNYGDNVERLEIGDPLQTWLEVKFAQHLKRCGVPQRTDGAHCLSFEDQLKWVREDPKRVKYVKTGWNSWQQKYSKN